MDDLNGLFCDRTFGKVKVTVLEGSTSIFGSRFLNELEAVGNNLKRKSLLVTQIYEAKGAKSIATKDPAVQRISKSLDLFIAVSSRRNTRTPAM